MERAPLRPVPRRPDGPVDPGDAIAHVAATVPAADETAGALVALVEIAGRSRSEAASEREIPAEEAAEALARGRKELRRSLYPLPGSGWCERAERMISDRMDGELEPPGPARLDAHLRNCSRCVEHELRLAQAIDALVAGFIRAHPTPVPAAQPTPIRPAVVRAARPELLVLPFGAPVAPAPARERVTEPPAEAAPPTEARPPAEAAPVAEQPPVENPPVETPPVEEPPVETPGGPAEPPREEPIVEPAARPALGATLAWRALTAFAILLAVLTVIITALGVSGVDVF